MNAKAATVATEIVREKPSARRNARALKTSSVHIQFEADGANIDNEASSAGGLQLASQVADLVGAAHEIFEQGEFPWQQVNWIAVTPNGPLNEVHLQGADLKSCEPRVAS